MTFLLLIIGSHRSLERCRLRQSSRKTIPCYRSEPREPSRFACLTLDIEDYKALTSEPSLAADWSHLGQEGSQRLGVPQRVPDSRSASSARMRATLLSEAHKRTTSERRSFPEGRCSGRSGGPQDPPSVCARKRDPVGNLRGDPVRLLLQLRRSSGQALRSSERNASHAKAHSRDSTLLVRGPCACARSLRKNSRPQRRRLGKRCRTACRARLGSAKRRAAVRRSDQRELANMPACSRAADSLPCLQRLKASSRLTLNMT